MLSMRYEHSLCPLSYSDTRHLVIVLDAGRLPRNVLVGSDL